MAQDSMAWNVAQINGGVLGTMRRRAVTEV
jgi:hypothetical protein